MFKINNIILTTSLVLLVLLGLELQQTKNDLEFYENLANQYQVSYDKAITTIDKLNQEKINQRG